jgi:hypothetical protein
MAQLKEEWIRVLEARIADPTASHKEISERTDIPKSTVWYAEKRMRDEDLLNVFAFPKLDEINDVKIGLIGGAIDGDKKAILQKVADHPNVWFLVDTIGPHSFTAGVIGKDANEFQLTINQLRKFGANGDHYGEIMEITKFGLDEEFLSGFLDDDTSIALE